MSISQGAKILKDDFNALFTRIEAVRTAHVSQGASIPATYQSSSVSAGASIKSSDVTTLNNALVNLSNSPWIDSSFTSGVTIPSVGTLIQASSISTIESKITTVEGITPGFTSAGAQGNFNSSSREGYFSSAASRGNFTSDANKGNFTSNASKGYFLTAANDGCFATGTRYSG